MAPKDFTKHNPTSGKNNTSKKTEKDKKVVSASSTTREVTPTKRGKGRPKTKEGTYKKVNLSIEENLLNQLKERADHETGGNLTRLINTILSDYLN